MRHGASRMPSPCKPADADGEALEWLPLSCNPGIGLRLVSSEDGGGEAARVPSFNLDAGQIDDGPQSVLGGPGKSRKTDTSAS